MSSVVRTLKGTRLLLQSENGSRVCTKENRASPVATHRIEKRSFIVVDAVTECWSKEARSMSRGTAKGKRPTRQVGGRDEEGLRALGLGEDSAS